MLARIISLWRSLLYSLYYRHVVRSRTTTRIDEMKLLIEPSVMHPKLFKSGKVFSDFLLTQNLKGKKILDMGTGSGILALTAARKGARVFASDINPAAVKCATENFRNNGFQSDIHLFSGHLFANVTESGYDIILFNPPYLEGNNGSTHQLALHGGEQLTLIKEFASQSISYLSPGGSLMLIVSTDSNVPLFLKIFRDQNYSHELLYRKTTLFETFYIYQFTPSKIQEDESVFVCPSCKGKLVKMEDQWKCENEMLSFPIRRGIPDFLPANRRTEIERFLEIYRTVRNSERWGSHDSRYYEELPYYDSTNLHSQVWAIRARSYVCLLEQLEQEASPRSLRVLDLGAGNGWLSLRLAQLGHLPVAVDIYEDDYDGLGVLKRLNNYERLIQVARAEFNHLPFSRNSVDVIIFNASLHYSNQPLHLIENTLQYLKSDGMMFIMDSPIYPDDASGNGMVEEKAQSFKRQHGIILPESLAGSFLTFRMLNHLKEHCTVDVLSPPYGWVWNLRPFLSKLRGSRTPASFAVVKIKKKNTSV